ncbi:MAG: ferritin-like domain-containing protein [Aquabacterium sp.]
MTAPHEASLYLECGAPAVMDFAYGGRPHLRELYEKGKLARWDANVALDWRIDVDPEAPLAYDDVFLPVYGSPIWLQAGSAEQTQIRHHYQAHTLSQFLHGEQAALLAAGRLIQVMPHALGKQFAAQQADDEARHIEVFERLISEKVGTRYGMDEGVLAFFKMGLSDPRWDFAVLTSQILIEGLALGLLQRLRDFSRNKLIKSIAMYIMADEARHVAFGLDELGDYYAQLSDAELRERAEFAQDGLDTLRRKLNPTAVWRELGLSERLDPAAPAQQSFERTMSKLTTRLEAMLERIRLRQSRGGVDAATRLQTWAMADERVFQKS